MTMYQYIHDISLILSGIFGTIVLIRHTKLFQGVANYANEKPLGHAVAIFGNVFLIISGDSEFIINIRPIFYSLIFFSTAFLLSSLLNNNKEIKHEKDTNGDTLG